MQFEKLALGEMIPEIEAGIPAIEQGNKQGNKNI